MGIKILFFEDYKATLKRIFVKINISNIPLLKHKIQKKLSL